MCNIGIYCTLGREYFPRPPASGNIPTLSTIYADIPLGRVEYLVYIHGHRPDYITLLACARG